MLLFVLATIAGLIMLVWGAERVVRGAAVTARNAGVSPMIIGLTILAFATSAPEIVVSITAAITDVTDIAIGNAIGSNIANIGLVAGGAAIVHPLVARSTTLRHELGAMTIITCTPFILFIDERLTRVDGLLLLTGLVGFLYWMVRLGSRTRGHDAIEAAYAAEIPANVRAATALLWLGVGLAVLIAGANSLVWGAKQIALAIGVSDVLIGITVVAVGTSLPELAVTIAAARKGEHGLALGNIIGSNAFNVLAVIGIGVVIRPTTLDPSLLRVHVPVMLAFTVVFYFITYNDTEKISVGRFAGLVLAAAFLAYHGLIGTQNL